MFLKYCFCMSFFLVFFSGCGVKEPFKEKSAHHAEDKEGTIEKAHYKIDEHKSYPKSKNLSGSQLPRPKGRSL